MLHPIVAQMSPSPEQEPAIKARNRDVVVTAGAGAGKTRTLVARYLSLLAEGTPLRSIVAITFTKKAAREMRNRVRDQVRRYLERTDLKASERQRWQHLYGELDAARIGTIHSLCTEMLHAHPAEAAIDPHFKVLDEGRMNILRGQAVDEALAWAAEDGQAVTLFSLLGELSLRSTLDQLMQKRLEVEAAFEHLPSDILSHWQQAIDERRRDVLQTLLNNTDWKQAVSTLKENVASDPGDKAEVQRHAVLAAIKKAKGSLNDQVSSLATLNMINLVGGSSKAWPDGKAQLDEVKNALKTLRDLWRASADLLEIVSTPMDALLAEAVPIVRASFQYASNRYAGLKRERDALDFDDLEDLSLKLLQQNPPVLARWQDELRAILVDEFQDTNGRQRDLIQLLNGSAGKLFVVGDAKQSIYLFRGADVSVFRAERDRVKRTGGLVCPLDTSYRAHRDLIDGLNALMRPVLGEQADPTRPWAEPFAPLGHYRTKPDPGFTPPHIELHLTVGSKGSGALDRAAGALAGRITQMVASGQFQIVENGQARPLDYGDFAILCRSSTSFNAYENALEQAQVPFLTVAGRGFYSRPEIRDLLNALQALADPSDDLTLMGLLRSPAIALSDRALYCLCQEPQQLGQPVSLWYTLRANASTLPDEDGQRAVRAVRLIVDLNHRVGRVSVADLLKAFLDETDYRAALIQARQTRAARNVSKLLADAHASEIVSVGEFLEYVGSLRDSGTREGEARATTEGAVQIMSVHAAKGLEFPVVAIGDITYGGQDRSDLLADPELGILLPVKDDEDVLPASYRLGKRVDDDKGQAELDRLLYVASTRACEKLILSGCIRLGRNGTIGKLGGWLGEIARKSGLELEDAQVNYDEAGDQAIQLDLCVGKTQVACMIYEPNVAHGQPPQKTQEPAEHKVTLPLLMLERISPEAETVDDHTREQDRIPPQRVWRVVPVAKRPHAPAWVIGSLVHEALAAWHFPDGTFDHWCEARARGYGISDERQMVDAVRETRRLLLRFQAHSLFEEMDQAERRLHEVPYDIQVGERVERGILDALYLRDGAWAIVEFKTDEIRNQADLEKLLEEGDYVTKARQYVTAVKRLVGQEPRFVLCMLDYDKAVYLRTNLVS